MKRKPRSFPWIMTQQWNNLLMIHWPVQPIELEKHIPKQFELDTFENGGWVSIILFQVDDMKLRKLPKVPYFVTFNQLNVRTYVTYKGMRGIYFFSLDADKWPIALGATVGALIPYKYANMSFQKKEQGINFKSQRKLSSEERKFSCSFQPRKNVSQPLRGSLDYWLTERYSYWSNIGKFVFRGDIEHESWEVSNANIQIEKNTMMPFLPQASLHSKPLLHFSKHKFVFIAPPKLISTATFTPNFSSRT